MTDPLVRSDVAYLRLIAQGDLDLVGHLDDCPVCGSLTSSDVKNLLKEMKLDWPSPIGQDITGKRMLGLGVCGLGELNFNQEGLTKAQSTLGTLHPFHMLTLPPVLPW